MREITEYILCSNNLCTEIGMLDIGIQNPCFKSPAVHNGGVWNQVIFMFLSNSKYSMTASCGKMSGKGIWEHLGLYNLESFITCFTILNTQTGAYLLPEIKSLEYGSCPVAIGSSVLNSHRQTQIVIHGPFFPAYKGHFCRPRRCLHFIFIGIDESSKPVL